MSPISSLSAVITVIPLAHGRAMLCDIKAVGEEKGHKKFPVSSF